MGTHLWGGTRRVCAIVSGAVLLLLATWVLASLAWAPVRAAEPRGGNRWALVVGINKYDDPEVTSLHYAEADALALRKTLVETAGYAEDRVILLTSTGSGRLRATRPNLVGWLVRLQKNIKPGDTFFFFFSGHGISLEKQSYLLTVDTVPDPVENLEMSALKMVDLRRLLEKIPASHKIIAVDACRNDPRASRGSGDQKMQASFSRGLVIRPTTPKAASEQVVATLYACRVGQRSYEWPESRQGFFSYYLVKGLKGAARNDRGQVTINSLIDYVETHVRSQVKLWKGEDAQTPWAEVAGTGAGRWVVVSNRGKGGAVASPQDPVAPASPDEPSPSPSPPDVAVAPAASPTPPPERPLIERAQEAFQAGHYVDPPGANVVEFTGRLLEQNPADAAARALQQRAQAEAEGLAAAARTRNDVFESLERYTRLSALFPSHAGYRSQVEALGTLAGCVGEWKLFVNILIFGARVHAVVNRDGSYVRWDHGSSHRINGTWRCTSIDNRTFEMTDGEGLNAVLTVSGDGQKIEGYDARGAHVSGSKVK